MSARTVLMAAVGLAAAAAASAAEAAYVYVGSWQVDDGPVWTRQPTAYSGLSAAALLFGGDPADYVISTVSAEAADIDFRAWYSILGVSVGTAFAQDYESSLAGGLYYDGESFPIGDLTNPASAFVEDNAVGAAFTNYAFVFVSDVPTPAAGLLLTASLGAFGLVRRRRA